MVAFSSVGPGATAAQATGATTLSWTHTNAAAGVALSVVGVFGDTASTGKSFTAANLDPTGANTPFAVTGGPLNSGTGGTLAGFIQMWGLPNTSSGAHTIKLTASVAPSNCLLGCSASYTGADTSAPFGTAQTNVNTSIGASHAITHTGSVSGNVVAFACCCGANYSASQPTGATMRSQNNFDTATRADNLNMADAASTGANITATWTTTASDWHGIIAVEIKATGGAPAGLIPQQLRGRRARPPVLTTAGASYR